MPRVLACGCFAVVLCVASVMVPSCSGSDSGDGGTPDSGRDGGSDAGPDGGPDAGPDGGPDAGPQCPAVDTSCPAYEDHTATGDGRTINFGGTFGLNYSPTCMKIARTQMVTFMGTFSTHPLRQDCGPAATITATTVGTTASFTFNTAGIYGYYCNNHRGTGMVGAIQVLP